MTTCSSRSPDARSAMYRYLSERASVIICPMHPGTAVNGCGAESRTRENGLMGPGWRPFLSAMLESVTGIGPASTPWQGGALPLCYTDMFINCFDRLLSPPVRTVFRKAVRTARPKTLKIGVRQGFRTLRKLILSQSCLPFAAIGHVTDDTAANCFSDTCFHVPRSITVPPTSFLLSSVLAPARRLELRSAV